MPKVLPEYKEEAKKRIICAALEVMGKKGYTNTTMDDIAVHLGVSKGAIYQYFHSRDELLAAFVKKMHEQNLNTAMRVFPKAAPLDAWTALFDQYMNLDDQYNALFFEIIAISVGNQAVKDIFSAEIMAGVAYATRGITRQQKKGLIQPGTDPRTTAVAITSLFIGMRSLVILGADREEIKKQWRDTGRVLLGIQPEETPAGENFLSDQTGLSSE